MITEVIDLGDGIEGYRTFTLAFSPGASLVHKLAAGPLTATKAVPDVPMQNGRPFFASEPVGDHLGDDNKPAFASLHAIVNAAQCPDFGFAQDCVRDGSIKPDTKLRGVAAWKIGSSANTAANTLAKLWAQHKSKNQQQLTRPVARAN